MAIEDPKDEKSEYDQVRDYDRILHLPLRAWKARQGLSGVECALTFWFCSDCVARSLREGAVSSHQLDPVTAALDAAIERALRNAPVGLRALLIAGEHGGGDIGVCRLTLRIVSELHAWDFGSDWKSSRSDLDKLFIAALNATGGRVVADMTAGDNRARAKVAVAIAAQLAARDIVMRPRMEAAE